MPHPYRLLLRTPTLPSAYLAVMLSAIPLGIVTLALVLSIQTWTGSLPLAGTVTAVFTTGNAVGLTVQGWLLDRYPARLVLAAAGLLSGLALTLVALLGPGLAPEVLAGLVLLAGLSVPAITTAVRRLLPALVVDAATRSAGYAVLSVTFQLAFAAGPLLVSLVLLLVGQAPAALLVAAVMVLVSAATFALAVASTDPARPDPADAASVTRLVLTRQLVLLYVVAALTGASTGMTTVAVPAVTQAAGAAAAAGVVFAASAVGDVTGAVLFGGRRWPLEERQQLLVALLASAAVAIAVFFSSTIVWLLVVTVGLGGVVGAPIAIRLSSLLDGLIRPQALGLGYATLIGVGLIAAAIGTAVAGRLSAWLDPRQLLLGPLVLLLLASTVTALRLGRPR